MIALSTITPLGSKYNILFSVSTSSDSNKDKRLEKIPTIISIKKRNVIELTTPFLNFTRILSDKVYQNTLVGSDFADLDKELRQTINGIYASSDDVEANKLVEFIEDNKFKKSMQSQVDKAVQTLQTKFARDRAGENMKRYAGQILNDSLRDFDATLNFNKSNDAGLTFVKYYGDVIPTTREICRNLINGVIKSKRSDGLFTIDEVRSLWASRSWSGKKAGNPLVVRGGYNCRHQWSYVNPDWYDSDGQLII